MQNGFVERLNGTIRTECLNLKVFKPYQKCKKIWTLGEPPLRWNSYNFGRSHSALKGKTPQMEWNNHNQGYLPSRMAAA